MIKKLWERLRKTREKLKKALAGIIRKRAPETIAALEEALIESDMGINTTEELIEHLKSVREEDYLNIIREHLVNKFSKSEDGECVSPCVYLFVGVNGVGKTTTIAKLGKKFAKMGKKVILAACDTYRAGAQEQLNIWAKKIKADIVLSQYGADPASVAYDAYNAALNRKKDILLIDTAGRLHTKHNLMEEMKKIKRVLQKLREDIPQEVLLVIDATVGQNGLSQAIEFHNALTLTGVVLTKLDGTAKGGIVISIAETLGIPIKFIGIGEKEDDLIPFDPYEFINAIIPEKMEV